MALQRTLAAPFLDVSADSFPGLAKRPLCTRSWVMQSLLTDLGDARWLAASERNRLPARDCVRGCPCRNLQLDRLF